MWPTEFSQFLKFLEGNLEDLHIIDSSAFSIDFPDFDLMPFDYLDFAESELDKESSSARINCITHLKRAIECELDTFLHIFKIQSSINNLPRKLEFAADAGLFSSRSIGKLNKARNKLEHEYSVPDTLELESYFDVATGFVYSVEGCIYILSRHREMSWERLTDSKDAYGGELDIEEQKITFWWDVNSERQQVVFTLSTSIKQFAYGLNVYLLLCKVSTLLSASHVIEKLKFLLAKG